jgi:hypothetical protein
MEPVFFRIFVIEDKVMYQMHSQTFFEPRNGPLSWENHPKMKQKFEKRRF